MQQSTFIGLGGVGYCSEPELLYLRNFFCVLTFGDMRKTPRSLRQARNQDGCDSNSSVVGRRLLASSGQLWSYDVGLACTFISAPQLLLGTLQYFCLDPLLCSLYLVVIFTALPRWVCFSTERGRGAGFVYSIGDVLQAFLRADMCRTAVDVWQKGYRSLRRREPGIRRPLSAVTARKYYSSSGRKRADQSTTRVSNGEL